MADSYATRNLSARFADHFRTLKLHEQQMIKSLFNPDGHTTPSFTMTVGVHNPRTISIPTHLVSTLSTSTVRSYLSYLAISSHFASTADPTESRHPLEGTCTWAQCKHLLESHIFGTIIGDADYQAYILSEMTKWLKPAQKPDLQVLEAVVLNNEASMELKDWVIKRMYEEDVVAQASFRAMVLTAAHRKRDEVRNGVRNSVHSSEGERRKSGEDIPRKLRTRWRGWSG
ncbi:hypothetical protein M011DRAFT_77901 [Sporormia fimetaria CBS 119925]|uniref:Uncharacterized protein n=1 Tax=Sporormia fimetaria CBS 119925 TaxID=1340428 RepID=A0A6A6VAH6_9PLEO|nr:hypothetical protein M011DRAFT_77901 [Sporormia fimetaria CBS 119925]